MKCSRLADPPSWPSSRGLAIAGFKRSLWLLVAAPAAHGLFDWLLAPLIPNPGVPPWWPQFCLAHDVVAAACLAHRLMRTAPTRS